MKIDTNTLNESPIVPSIPYEPSACKKQKAKIDLIKILEIE